MSTAVSVESRIARVEVTDETITAHVVDGRVISVPLAWSWRLSDATSTQRATSRIQTAITCAFSVKRSNELRILVA